MNLLKFKKEASLLLQFLNLPRQNHHHLSQSLLLRPDPHQSPRQSPLLHPAPRQSPLLHPAPLLHPLLSQGPHQHRLGDVLGLKEENLLELIRRRSTASASLDERILPRCHAPLARFGTLRSAYAIGQSNFTSVRPSAFFLDHHHYHHLYDP